MSERFQIVTSETCSQWDSYVQDHPKGTIFHTAAMVRVFGATRFYKPLAIAARTSDGRIVALLVAVRVQRLGFLL